MDWPVLSDRRVATPRAFRHDARVLLPNADRAIIPDAKVRDYLLAPTHPQGASKARFFSRFGFEQSRWDLLADALMRHARECPATATARTIHGQKWETIGAVTCPDGRIVQIKVAWIVLVGDTVPRLVTAVPGDPT